MKPLLTSRTVIVAVVLAISAVGCGSAPANAQQAQSAADTLPIVLATVGNEKITLADVRVRIGDEFDKLDVEHQRIRYRRIYGTLSVIVRDRALNFEARRQGKTVDELLEATAGISLEPTEAEISEWYAENQDRMRGRPFDEVWPQIIVYLRTQRRAVAAAAVEEQLRRHGDLVVYLQPLRIPFDNSRAPARGHRDSPVILVEFADFECPFCSRFNATLKRIEQKYGDRIAIIYRQFPLSRIHPRALKAAEASLCAYDQDKFWEMHDLMYQEYAKLSVANLKEKARRLGLDAAAFDACLDSGKHAEQVQRDHKEGTLAGVNSTPTIFLNGEALEESTITYELMSAAIDRELARRK